MKKRYRLLHANINLRTENARLKKEQRVTPFLSAILNFSQPQQVIGGFGYNCRHIVNWSE